MRVEIKSNGKIIPARFGILALRKYAEHYNLSLDEVGLHIGKASVFGIADLFYFAYLSDCELGDRVPEAEYSKAGFTDLLEDLTEAQLTQISEAINDIKLFGKKLSEMAEEGTKKKALKK